MEKENIIQFFDKLASDWDANAVHDEVKINRILDYAQVSEGVRVLDVACGTGILMPDYLVRKVNKVTGVDISAAMIGIAQKKFTDCRIELIHGDIEEMDFPGDFDCCMVYNAFPHFPYPGRLIEKLSAMLAEKGRLTIAHGMSREKINAHHSGSASKVSIGLMEENELAFLMQNFLQVDTVVADQDIYVVSGTRQ